MEKIKRNIKWYEITLIVVALWVVFLFVSPLFHRMRTRGGPGCTSKLRQLAMSVTMYLQDNKNRLPGLYQCDGVGNKLSTYTGWAGVILPYVYGDTDEAKADMFHCPDIDEKMKKYVSYGYNAALLQPDGMGIEEKKILQPTKLGLLCDAEPLKDNINEGGIVAGEGFILTDAVNKATQLTVKPVGRHMGTVVVGYADGHASGVPNYNEKDPNDGVIRAFYLARELGFIKKATAGGR